MILNWYYIFLSGIIHFGKVYTNEKKTLLPELVNSIVENEIARKLPNGKVSERKGNKRNRLAGSHMKAATDAINKLVDESIVNRVEEAEKEVSQMLLRNIEHHIQDAGKIFKTPDKEGTLSSTFDRSPCRDKLDSCEKLSQAGVCKTSRDAMRENCRHTCNYCHVMLDHDMQAKLAKELESHEDGTNKVLSIKFRHKGKKHRKHHLATDEVGMLGSELKEHEPELEKLPTLVQPAASRDEDEQAQELERIKGEANKLLAAQRKIKQEKLAEKERHEAEKLLETEKKIKEEEQREIELTRKHQQKKKKRKKQMVHKPSSKGTSSFVSFRPENKLLDLNAIPFLNEDPYPLTDFVTQYDKSSSYGRNSVSKARNAKMDETVLLNRNDDIEPEYEPGPKKYTNTHTDIKLEDIDDKMDENMQKRKSDFYPRLHKSISTYPELELYTKRNSNPQTFAKLDDDIDENYSPQNLILKYNNDKHELNDDTTTTRRLDRGDVTQHATETAQDITETDTSNNEERERGYEQARVDDTEIERYLPMLNENDAMLGQTRTHHNHHSGSLSDERRRLTGIRKGYRKMYIDNKNTYTYSKPKMRNDIQNMIDKAFGEVLETN